MKRTFKISKRKKVELRIDFPSPVIFGAGAAFVAEGRDRSHVVGVHLLFISFFVTTLSRVSRFREYVREYGFGFLTGLRASIAFGRTVVFSLNPVLIFGMKETEVDLRTDTVDIPLVDGTRKAKFRLYERRWKYRAWPFVKKIRMVQLTLDEPVVVSDNGDAIREGNLPENVGRDAADYAILFVREIEGHRFKNNYTPK